MPVQILVVREGPLAGRRLIVDSELVFGRADSDVELDDDEVSRRHASIRVEGGRLVVYDLDSLNGTWVNGDRVAVGQPLASGDVIRLGTTAIELVEYQMASAAGQPPPAAAPEERAKAPAPVAGPAPRRLVGIGLAAALILELIFASSYIGAAHSPSPRELPIAIVGPPAATADAAKRILAGGDQLKPIALRSDRELTNKIDHRSVYGGLVLGAKGDTLVVADAANISVSDLLVKAFTSFEASQHRPLTVTHVKPLPPGDSRGLTSFYAAVAWVFGGYLGATILSALGGAAARGRRHAAQRIGALALYALLSGILGALVAGPIFGALPGHLLALMSIGALLVFATALTTSGLQTLLGMAGTAVALVAFLIVGNPASGGPVATELLPGFWRGVGAWLPPGAGVTSVRNTVYFGGNGVAASLGVLAVYAVVGAALLLLTGARRSMRAADVEIELATAAAA